MKKNQSGVALVVSLVMLVVITLLGVSNMTVSTTDLRISANSQLKNIAFQASQSTTDMVISLQTQAGADNFTNLTARDYTYPNDVAAAPEANQARGTARLEFVGCQSPVPGYSIGKLANANIFSITSTGLSESEGVSQSLQVQGIAKITPGDCIPPTPSAP